MIFVTVGTHEQQFNRLIKEVDRLVEEGMIKEEVFIQTGYSDYEPRYCKFKKFLGYDEMEKYIEDSNIVITHGGPASFMGVLNKNKVPIVVPRKLEFKEHVNNHQLDFAKKILSNGYQIILIDDIKDLKNKIFQESIINDMKLSSNHFFIDEFNKVINSIWEN